jgi:hypothetical protein
MNRKSAPKVKAGRVQKKNNWAETPRKSGEGMPLIDRQRPGDGYRHLLKRRDIEEFISILPDWDELSRGLESVVLSAHDDSMGWHKPGSIGISSWEAKVWWENADPDFVELHRDILERLDVEMDKRGDDLIVKWTEPQARAFQLLHIFLHELGHHHDRMTTRPKYEAARGEPFAETYASRYADRIWDTYVSRFEI